MVGRLMFVDNAQFEEEALEPCSVAVRVIDFRTKGRGIYITQQIQQHLLEQQQHHSTDPTTFPRTK